MGIYCEKCFKTKKIKDEEKHDSTHNEIKVINQSNMDHLFNQKSVIPQNDPKNGSNKILLEKGQITNFNKNQDIIENANPQLNEIEDKSHKDFHLM